MDVTIKNKIIFYLGSKSLWFIGSSIVYWGEQKALSRAGGRHLGLQNRGVNIRWFGKRGMLWSELTATVEKKIDSLPLPFLLIIQLKSNDLGMVSTYDLIQDIKRDILRLSLLLLKTHIVWIEILMRRYWHVANDGRAIELVRKCVNSAVNNFMVNENHFIVHHPNIRARERSLYRFDGTHLSDTGYDIP
jgi:hypothetical protein